MSEELDFYGRIHSGYYNPKPFNFDYEEYKKELVFEIDSQPLTRPQYEAALSQINDEIKALKKKHRDEQAEKTGKLIDEFRKDCEIEFGFESLPVKIKDKLHWMAYGDGLAWGFSSIANCYPDLVELVFICKEEFFNVNLPW